MSRHAIRRAVQRAATEATADEALKAAGAAGLVPDPAIVKPKTKPARRKPARKAAKRKAVR